LIYWDRDTTGQPIQLNAVSIFSAIEGVYSNKIRSKHSENILERLLRVCVATKSLLTSSLTTPYKKVFNSSLTRTEGFIIAHPYMAVLLILGFLAAVVMAIKKLLDDDSDLQSGYRYTKGGRLD
jgi:hypothetical protein